MNIEKPVCALPFKLHPPTEPVSNSAFLQEIFRGILPDAVLWLTSFNGDPNNAGPNDWTGYGVRLDQLALTGIDRVGDAGANTFFTISSFLGHLDENTGHRFGAARRKALHSLTHVFVLDDIGYGPGAKISPDKLPGLEPSYILETSPDNWQVGYVLIEPVASAVLAAKFLDALVTDGLQEAKDPGMKGVTRNVRLPVGRNGKAKYTIRGESPHHRLLHWKPSTRYQLEDLCGGFGLDLASIEVAVDAPEGGHRSWMTLETDPWIAVLAATGSWMDTPNDKGPDGVWVNMECLWNHEHTDGDDSGAAYCIGGGYQCHHGHCIDKTWIDARGELLNWDHDDGTVRGLAGSVRAQEAFGDHWMLGDGDAPPLPARPEEGATEPVPVRSHDAILQDARMLRPDWSEAGLRKVRDLLRDIDAARTTGTHLAAELKEIADKSGLPIAELKKDLDAMQAERAIARQKVAVEKQAADQAKGVLSGRRPTALLAPGALAVDTDGTPFVDTTNVERVIQGLGGEIRWNEMLLQEEATGPLAGRSADSVVRLVQDAMEINGLRRNQQAAVPILRMIAEENGYHPMQQYLRRLKAGGGWDGVDRLRGTGGLFNTIKLQDESKENRDLANLILSKWLYAIIAAAHFAYRGQPGNQPRGVLVFTGGQHTGKTTWLARLFEGLFPGSERCFIGGAHFAGMTDDKLNVLGALVTELGEIDSTLNRSEAGMLKAFLSNDMDRVRRPYGKAHTDIPRRTVFCGTVNDPQYLKDRTGNTRFWSVAIRRMDLDAQRTMDMPQVWAQIQDECRTKMMEAKAAQGYAALPWHMSNEEMARIEEANEDHRVLSAVEEWLLDTFDWDDKEWLALKPGTERLRINGQSMKELMALHGSNGRQWSAEWLDALRRRTGQQNAMRRVVEVIQWGELGERKIEVVDGREKIQRKEKSGRLWGMPPPLPKSMPTMMSDEDVAEAEKNRAAAAEQAAIAQNALAGIVAPPGPPH